MMRRPRLRAGPDGDDGEVVVVGVRVHHGRVDTGFSGARVQVVDGGVFPVEFEVVGKVHLLTQGSKAEGREQDQVAVGDVLPAGQPVADQGEFLATLGKEAAERVEAGGLAETGIDLLRPGFGMEVVGHLADAVALLQFFGVFTWESRR
ncbi:MAG: hypothetical protein QM757_18485 [Paludibaculum sp.]